MLKNSHKKLMTMCFVLMLVSSILSTLVGMYSLDQLGQQNQRDLGLVLAARIHDRINNKLTEPIMVAKTMANSEHLIDFLRNTESGTDEAANIHEMQRYLSRLKDGLRYDAVFVVSDETGRYYTNVGLNKIVDPVNDEHDIWYSIFVEKNKEYDLDVDVDEVHDNAWTVFVNARVEHEGELLGVCGVGVKMTDLQSMIYEYEDEYNVKINLIDANGLVQVDTDEVNIENAYLKDVPVDVRNNREYVYREHKRGEYTVSKYDENLGWYLVVQSHDYALDEGLIRIILFNGGLFCVLMISFAVYMQIIRRRTNSLLNSSYFDQLTGIQNRRAYEEALERLGMNKIDPQFVFGIVDVNGLKRTNDNQGHVAGDEIIKAAAEMIQETFSEYGEVFRIGGDEFTLILNITPEQFEGLIEGFKEKVAGWHGTLVKDLSVSVGCVPRWEAQTLTLQEIIQEADQRMYSDKEAYYSVHGNNRRR